MMIRLSLYPAAALLQMSVERQCASPSQLLLDEYLARIPGQRAAVGGFVRYVRETHHVDVVLPRPLKPSRVKVRKDIEVRLAKMLVDGLNHEDRRLRVLELALRYFHGLEKSAACAMANLSAVAVNRKGDWALVDSGGSY